ncbi:MAG: hypothetical protein R3B99_07770 [Polyangiales bacterium]
MIPDEANEDPATLSVVEAEREQARLATRIETHDRFGEVRHIAGADVAYEKDGDVSSLR